jgi:hypothetical protein
VPKGLRFWALIHREMWVSLERCGALHGRPAQMAHSTGSDAPFGLCCHAFYYWDWFCMLRSRQCNLLPDLFVLLPTIRQQKPTRAQANISSAITAFQGNVVSAYGCQEDWEAPYGAGHRLLWWVNLSHGWHWHPAHCQCSSCHPTACSVKDRQCSKRIWLNG